MMIFKELTFCGEKCQTLDIWGEEKLLRHYFIFKGHLCSIWVGDDEKTKKDCEDHLNPLDYKDRQFIKNGKIIYEIIN